MKRITIWTIAAVVLILMAVVIVRAETRGQHGWCGHAWHRRGPASYVARELKLNPSQRAQIQALWEAERPAISADVHQFLAENKEMNALAAQGNPDQSKVKEIADREAATMATLLVEKVRLQSKIYTSVLNAEQRTKADELEKKWESRLDHAAARLETQPSEQ